MQTQVHKPALQRMARTTANASMRLEETEMRILEASIEKITQLLAVSFGVAGVEIITENMKDMGVISPMVPGHRTVRCSSVFSFHLCIL